MQQTTNMIDSVHNLEHTGMSRAQAEALTKWVRASVTESVQHLATKAELADLKAHVDAQHLATKAELVDLKAHVDAQHLATKAGLARLEASHKAHMEHTDAQIALLRGDLTEKMGKNLKYMALTTGLATVATIAAFFVAVFFAMPAAS